jgi:hypothetical protein
MAAHWWRAGRNKTEYLTRVKLAINGTGGAATGAALAIIIVAKFAEGAWISVIIVPIAVVLLLAIGRYYRALDKLLLSGADRAFSISEERMPRVLVPIERWDRIARKALGYAITLSDDVTVLHVSRLEGPDKQTDDAESQQLRSDWEEFVTKPMRKAERPVPAFRVMRSEYRSILAPVLRVIEEDKTERRVIVVLPELVEGSWWERLFHVHRERRLRARLLRYGDRPLAVLAVPWQLRAQTLHEELRTEEPPLAVPTAVEE